LDLPFNCPSDTQKTDDKTSDETDGTATTTDSQTTSTGNYDNSTDDTENDTHNVTQHQGPLTVTDAQTNYSHPTTDDKGTFDDSPDSDTVDGTFNDGLNARTTEDWA
jgi:hypothetical protein